MDIRNLTPSTRTVRVMNAQAAGATVVNSSAVDTAGFYSCRFVALFGALTATQVTNIQVQHSDDGSTGWNDLAGSRTANLADTDGNRMLVVDVHRPQRRFLRCVVNRGTANAVIDGVIAELYLASDVPVVQDASLVSNRVLNTPATGTP